MPMELVIKEWPNQTASLMTGNGYTLSLFDSVKEAQAACDAWYAVHKLTIPQRQQEPSFSSTVFDE